MCTPKTGGRNRTERALLAAAVATLAATPSLSPAQVTLTKNSSTNWTINNGDITAIFNPTNEDITSIQLAGGGGASPNLLGGTTPELDEETAGTPFGAGAQTFESQIGPNNSYVDVWTNVASTGTSVNPITYAFHYVLFANDPTVYCYEVLNHSATDPTTTITSTGATVGLSVGQGQFLFRSNPSLFPNLYQVNTGPNQLGTANAQTTIGIPSTNPNWTTVTNEHTGTGTSEVFYRTVSNVTYDLTGSGIAGDNGTNFFTKYDYSTYTQFFQAETMYGSQYAVSEVDPSTDTLTGGPTKQELAWTDPGILNMEFLSDHYGIDSANGFGTGAYPGYGYFPTPGIATSKLYGPYGFTVSSTTAGNTAAQINQTVINAIPNDQAEFATDSELAASGYVPNSSRGSVQINAANSAGWSSVEANTGTSMVYQNNTVVLSEPGVNFQESTQGNEYTAQIAPDGTATIANVVPGTYRLSMYELGQWGETRVDGVQVQNGQVTIPQNLKFTPENFGTAAPIWTIGTPNRSANEFMNGHTSTGTDLRQYQGAYDFWAEEQALGTPGYVSYNATATTIGGVAEPATNNPNAWIANQWQTFDPGLYDSNNDTTDNYNNTAPAYVTAGGGPANYHGSPWQVHFETTAAQNAQGQFVVLSVGLVAQDASLVVTLNGHSETWSYNNFAPDDPMSRSGDAGFYQWAAFQFPVADLNAVGTDNEFTFGVSSHAEGVMYDALRMEITNTSASPTVTGWDDYTYINGSTQVAQNDAVSIPTLTWTNAGGTGDGMTWDTGASQNWTTGLVSWTTSANETTFSSGANVVFNDSNNGHYNVTLNTTVTPNSILVNNSSGNYVIAGSGEIAGSGGLAKYGTGTLTLACTGIYTGGTTISAGSLQIGNGGTSGSIAGNITDNANLAFDRSDSITFSNTVSGTGSLAQTGSGTLVLTGTNTYTGGTTISAGSLQIGDGGTTGSITGNITDNANLTFDRSDSPTISSIISGSGSLTQAGTGVVTLTSTNTYTGNTTINNGVLVAGVNNALPTTTNLTINTGYLGINPGVTQTIASLAGPGNGIGFAGGILIVNQSINTEFDGFIYDGNEFGQPTQVGELIKQGNGKLTLTGNNDYYGGTTISGGILQIGTGGSLGSIPGNILDNAQLTYNLNVTSTISGIISGSGSMTQMGGGTLVLTATNTYTGGTTIASASTIQLGNGATTGSISSTGAIIDNGNLTFDRSDSITFPNYVHGIGSITQAGTGTVTLSASNNNNGGTNVTSGKLIISAIDGLAVAPVSITGGVLQLAEGIGPEVITSLGITAGGALDISNNSLLIDYGSGPDPIASIAQWITNGFYGLPGPQIISSDIATDDAASGLSYGIGYADGADGLVAGLPSGEIEIAYTLLGDANLDGTVNSEDFTPFSHNLGQSGSWDDGDFNYDGIVNAEDFTSFSHNLNQSATLAGPGDFVADGGLSLSNVPEPAMVALLVFSGVGLLPRRGRKLHR